MRDMFLLRKIIYFAFGSQESLDHIGGKSLQNFWRIVCRLRFRLIRGQGQVHFLARQNPSRLVTVALPLKSRFLEDV